MIQEQIERLRTLQESLDDLTDKYEELAIGEGGGGNIDLTDVAKLQTLLQESEAIKQILAEIKTATDAIGVLSNEDIDTLFK